MTRKISNALARIKLGLQRTVELGNLTAQRDWGFAPEYVEAMWLMLQHSESEDFVVSTDETHSVMEFVQLACNYGDLDPKQVVAKNDRYLRPIDVNWLRGDSTKAKQILKWEPKVTFKGLCGIMVQKDIERWQAHLYGKIFPWDAINDPSIY